MFAVVSNRRQGPIDVSGKEIVENEKYWNVLSLLFYLATRC
ncbi:hypothetical protein CPter291_1176 [Collimonas pratensis]|uniref:Uncharacterized protein n=1 Tax=Collimonas pratensis TaxID=279113 RepID=A0ABM5Z306_9BURK|nr:hypothetical protein CPter291_1176 [Collimonas pratensis]